MKTIEVKLHQFEELNEEGKGMGLCPTKQYKTCDRCCYDILDNYGDIIEHYCIDNELY